MNAYENYLKTINKRPIERPQSKYKKKLSYLKRLIREYVHENAALVDELEEVQTNIIIRMEERKYLLRKLCEYEPQVAAEVQNLAKLGYHSNNQSTSNNDLKKIKKRPDLLSNDTKKLKPKKSKPKNKKIIQAIPLDGSGRPIFPIELGNNLKIHCLGEIISDRVEYHTENTLYPIGYLATRTYGNLEDPTKKCTYTCKIEECTSGPRFVIESINDSSPIIGDTPDVCHSLLLQRINDSLSLNVVSTRPRGHEFFGLTNPIVLNLLQSLPGARKCINYRWNRFEIAAKSGTPTIESENDAGLSYEYLQRSINFCKYKMAPDILQKPSDEYLDTKNNLHDYLM